MKIFWLETLPREIRATQWRCWLKAPCDVGLLTWKAAISKSGITNPLFEFSWPSCVFGTFSKNFFTFRKS